MPLYGGLPPDLPELVRDLRNEMVGEIIIGVSAVPEVPELDGVTIIRAEQRLTLASAKNRAAYHATQQYLLFLDIDNRVGQGAVGAMRDALEEGATVIAAAATCYQGDRARGVLRGEPSSLEWLDAVRTLDTEVSGFRRAECQSLLSRCSCKCLHDEEG